MNQDCIFCKIVNGDIPSTKVYEDVDTLAFMDINPVSKGHTLVIPKRHYDPITETPPEVLQKVIIVVRKIARAQYAGLGMAGLNVTQANGKLAGQIIPHIHFHLIPRYELAGKPAHWVPGHYETPAEMESYAAKIRNALE